MPGQRGQTTQPAGSRLGPPSDLGRPSPKAGPLSPAPPPPAALARLITREPKAAQQPAVIAWRSRGRGSCHSAALPPAGDGMRVPPTPLGGGGLDPGCCRGGFQALGGGERGGEKGKELPQRAGEGRATHVWRRKRSGSGTRPASPSAPCGCSGPSSLRDQAGIGVHAPFPPGSPPPKSRRPAPLKHTQAPPVPTAIAGLLLASQKAASRFPPPQPRSSGRCRLLAGLAAASCWREGGRTAGCPSLWARCERKREVPPGQDKGGAYALCLAGGAGLSPRAGCLWALAIGPPGGGGAPPHPIVPGLHSGMAAW